MTPFELKRLCNLLIDRTEKAQGKEIVLDFDWYWTVNTDDKYNFRLERPSVSIGSISDDIDGLKRLFQKGSEPTPLDLERLGQLFIALSEKIQKGPYIL